MLIHTAVIIRNMEELFDLTMKRYDIEAKSLSLLTGVSQTHISQFRLGKLKTGVTTDCLMRLLIGMDQLSPGARRYFCDLLAGKKKEQRDFAAELEFLIDAADELELESAMMQIVRRMFPKEDDSSENTDAIKRKNRVKSSVLN